MGIRWILAQLVSFLRWTGIIGIPEGETKKPESRRERTRRPPRRLAPPGRGRKQLPWGGHRVLRPP